MKQSDGCEGWIDELFYNGDCTLTTKLRYKEVFNLYLCTAEDLDASQYMCPSGATVYLGEYTSDVLSTEVTHNITIAEYQEGVDPIDILFGSWIKCAQKIVPGGASGSWGGCAWATVDVASLFAGKIIRPIADAVKAVDAAAKTGIRFTDAYKALRSLGLPEAAVAGITRASFQQLRNLCLKSGLAAKTRGRQPVHGPAGETPALAGNVSCPTYIDVYPSGLGIVADIDKDGLVSFVIKAGSDTPRGSEMFNAALAHYGSNVKGVKAYWQNGGDLSDNLDSFNAAVRGGASLEEAALATFTGKMSQRAGFSHVEITELRGMPGHYTNVGAAFR